MNADEILAHARAAGARGDTWVEFTCYDPALAAYCEAHVETFDASAIERAFCAGELERRTATWVHVWTTASSAYDGFGTVALDRGAWKGRELRHVLVDPRYLDWHRARYASGLGGYFDADPRVAEASDAAKRERWRLEDESRAAKQAAGVAWLTTLPYEKLADLIDRDELEQERGIGNREVRAERAARDKVAADAETAARWARCRASFADGVTLIDHGTPGMQGVYGWIKGVPTHVYYEVRIEPDWQHPNSAQFAQVVGLIRCPRSTWGRKDVAGPLEYVADWFATGRMTIAADGEAPPEPVLRRFGHDRLKDVVAVPAEGKSPAVWAMRERWGSEITILNADGRKVRTRATRDHAMAHLEHAEAARFGGKSA